MIRFIAAAGIGALLALAAADAASDARAESAAADWSSKVSVARSVDKTIASWPYYARAVARDTIAQYGSPDEVGDNALVWYADGPWKKTTVHRLGWPHYTFKRDKDYLENAIGYAVPDDRLADLTRFDKRLSADQASAELSSRSESERMNFLALNIADEVIRGKRTVEEAREFYRKTERLASAGKSSPYLVGLLFEVDNAAAPDPRRRP
jgi:hypothetical protein